MSSRKQRCNGCGMKLMVPPEAKTMRCTSCQAVTRVQPLDSLDRTQDLFREGDRWVKGFISTLSNKIDSFASSMNNGHSGSSYYSGTSSPSYSCGYPPPASAAPSYSYPPPASAAPSYSYPPPASVAPSYSYGYPPPSVSTTPLYGYGYPPPPAAASCPLSFPTVHGKKRALLCGIRYRARRYELKGSINDVNCMKYFLVEKCGFPKESILVLSEDERNPYLIPTRQNLKMAMQWLVQGCKSGDSLVFHYSGHGSRKVNYTQDEVDGYDETLCPLDFETQGMILDNEINATIVRPLPKGVILHAIIDACHSGTVLDLPFLCRMNQNGYYVWENHNPPTGAYKGTNGGLALSYSACDDHQTSADTSVFSGNAMTGAMTYSFIHAAQSAPAGLTYGALLNAMRVAIRDANKGMQSSSSGPIVSFLRKILFTGLSQEPQLSASETFDIYATKFVL